MVVLGGGCFLMSEVPLHGRRSRSTLLFHLCDFFFFFITLGLEMSDTQVYEP